MSLLPGIVAQTVRTDRLTHQVLRRAPGETGGTPLVLVHGQVSSAAFWQPLLLALPAEIDAVAVDLRGFGGSQTAPVDATRGLRDFADDLAELVAALDLGAVHLAGWGLGGGVVMQYALDHPVASLTLIAPVSPYGFGGTGADGRRLSDDGAGTGGGGANPEFVARIGSGDDETRGPSSPRSVFATAYVRPGFRSRHEDLWVASMLSTATGTANYPGDATPSPSWPGFAPGRCGVLNAIAPTHLDLSGIVDLAEKPPVLWIRGLDDLVVSDTSLLDLNFLGRLGIVPGWPGEATAPPQPMVAQTRRVLEAYAARGGSFTELALPDCGHSPHLERTDEVRTALLTHLARSPTRPYAGPSPSAGPPAVGP